MCGIAEIVAPEIDFPTIAEVGGRPLFCVAVANEIMSNGSHDRSHNRVSVFGGLPELMSSIAYPLAIHFALDGFT